MSSIVDPLEGPLELTDDGPRLRAGRCSSCAQPVFPVRARCPICGEAIDPILLPRSGTLWTWTTQDFEPPSPPFVPLGDGPFDPYAVGYVEFAGFLRVEGPLVQVDREKIRIGMTLEVAALPREGHTTAFAFVPVSGGL